MGRVSNEPLRRAYEQSGLSSVAVARELGFYTTMKKGGPKLPDTSRVKRTLGLMPRMDREGTRAYPRFVHEKTALRFAEALGVDPVDLGL